MAFLLCSGLNADVLITKFGTLADEITHELFALIGLKVDQLHAPALGIVFGPFESLIFSDDNPRDFIKKDRARAHIAGRKRRINPALLIIGGFKPARAFQAIHFRVQHRRSLLPAPVMPAADDLTIL